MSAFAPRPDALVWALFAGVLLIYAECNRPGRIVPGCAGGLLVLLSLHNLAAFSISPGGLFLTIFGLALTLFSAVAPSPKLAAACATVVISMGLAHLVQPRASAYVHWVTAVLVGTGVGATTSWLALVAVRARRNKRLSSRSTAAA